MKDFTLYPEALELKQLGFDEPCFAFYNYNSQLCRYMNPDKDWNSLNHQQLKNSKITLPDTHTAPTYSQAFRWFRDKGYRYTISSDCFEKNGMFYFEAWKHKQFTFDSGLVYSTYEEAELACLQHLIKIVKERQK